MTKTRIFGLDILRAVAITCVIVSHTYPILVPTVAGDRVAFYLGYIGVEVFFLLSGFLIGGILIQIQRDDTKTVWTKIEKFWIRRWLRTLPNYYLILLVFYLFSIFIKKDFSATYLYYTVFSQNLFHRMPGFFLVSWSLSIEEWFYLLFPLLMFFFGTLLKTRAQKINNTIPILLTILSMLIGSFIFRYMQSFQSEFNWNLDFRKVVFTRLDSLAIGVLSAYLKQSHEKFWERNKFISLSVGMICFVSLSLVFISKTIYFHNEDRLFKVFFLPLFSISISLLVPFFFSISKRSNHLFHTIITRTSLYSYSMYLSHIIIVTILLGIVEQAKKITPVPNFLTFVSSLLGIYFLGAVQYKYFEKPIMDLREKF